MRLVKQSCVVLAVPTKYRRDRRTDDRTERQLSTT